MRAWQAAEPLGALEAAHAMETSHAIWPDGVPTQVQQTNTWKAAETTAAGAAQHEENSVEGEQAQQVRNCDPPLVPMSQLLVSRRVLHQAGRGSWWPSRLLQGIACAVDPHRCYRRPRGRVDAASSICRQVAL